MANSAHLAYLLDLTNYFGERTQEAFYERLQPWGSAFMALFGREHLPIRAKRAHYRLSWAERLARNARPETSGRVMIKLFGVPGAFAQSIGLSIL